MCLLSTRIFVRITDHIFSFFRAFHVWFLCLFFRTDARCSGSRSLESAMKARVMKGNTEQMIMITHDIEEAVYLSDRIVVLDTRPCSVKEIIDINLPHPRDRKSRRFEEYRSNVVSSFRSTIDSYAYSI